jgi:hypothetical protein
VTENKPNWSDPNDPAWETQADKIVPAEHLISLGIEAMTQQGFTLDQGLSDAATEADGEKSLYYFKRNQ